MSDERDPEKDRRHVVDDGYFGWPEGQDAVQFLDDDGCPMSHEEWLAYLEEKREDHHVIGSGTADDPYRLRGTEPHG